MMLIYHFKKLFNKSLWMPIAASILVMAFYQTFLLDKEYIQIFSLIHAAITTVIIIWIPYVLIILNESNNETEFALIKSKGYSNNKIIIHKIIALLITVFLAIIICFMWMIIVGLATYSPWKFSLWITNAFNSAGYTLIILAIIITVAIPLGYYFKNIMGYLIGVVLSLWIFSYEIENGIIFDQIVSGAYGGTVLDWVLYFIVVILIAIPGIILIYLIEYKNITTKWVKSQSTYDFEKTELKGITQKVGRETILDNVNFKINDRKVNILMGPNGSGKSSLIKILLNQWVSNDGVVSLTYENIAIVDISPELPFYFTGYKLFSLTDTLEKRSYTRTELNLLLDHFELKDQDLFKKINKLSSGMKKKVMLVNAFLSDFDLLILDEPNEALDPIIRDKVLEKIIETKKKKKTILIASHVLEQLDGYYDCVTVIDDGKIVYENKITDKKLLEIYEEYL